MTITKIREVPSKLPPACLYLDDIREITNILIDAYTPVVARAGKEATVMYTFGKCAEGDSRAMSIDDLRGVGGSSTYFRISVYELDCDFWGGEVRIYNTLPPEAHLSALSDNEARATYQKIEAVFLHRVLAFQHAISQLPSRLNWVIWITPLILPLLLISLRASLAAKVALALIFYALFFGGLIWYSQPSRVVFADSYDKSREKTEARKSYVRDLVFAVLGAGLTLLVQVILKKWF